jgi:hypothetical protein
MGANEERIKNMRKKELIEKNTRNRSNNNSKSAGLRKRWDAVGQERSKSKNRDSMRSGINYQAISKLILNNNPGLRNIHTKTDVNSIDEVVAKDKRSRRTWDDVKLGIVFPEFSSSVEPKIHQAPEVDVNNSIEERVNQQIVSNMKASSSTIRFDKDGRDINNHFWNDNSELYSVKRETPMNLQENSGIMLLNDSYEVLREEMITSTKSRKPIFTRPMSSIMNISKINTVKESVKPLLNLHCESPNKTSNIEFIYKSPKNFELKSTRPLSQIQKKQQVRTVYKPLNKSNRETTMSTKSIKKTVTQYPPILSHASPKEIKKNDILSKIEKLDERRLTKLAQVIDKLAVDESINVTESKNTLFNSKKNMDSLIFNNFKNKYNVDYIKTESINFANFNIKEDVEKSRSTDKRHIQMFEDELSGLVVEEDIVNNRDTDKRIIFNNPFGRQSKQHKFI